MLSLLFSRDIRSLIVTDVTFTVGRPSHRVFRGRLGVYTCCGLPTCRQPDAAFFPPGLVQFVTSMTAGIATRLERPLPEQDLHVLEQLTFHGAPGPIHPSLPGHRACRVMRFGAF